MRRSSVAPASAKRPVASCGGYRIVRSAGFSAEAYFGISAAATTRNGASSGGSRIAPPRAIPARRLTENRIGNAKLIRFFLLTIRENTGSPWAMQWLRRRHHCGVGEGKAERSANRHFAAANGSNERSEAPVAQQLGALPAGRDCLASLHVQKQPSPARRLCPRDAVGVHDPGAMDADILRRIEGLGEFRQGHADEMLASQRPYFCVIVRAADAHHRIDVERS